jgi:FAD/FMN-containing dehydrogenase/Fe-S oxidoreductase/NAD(P)-dependent dehydrogenase (short-subunit alcohol dehydrogenase family)
VKNMQLDIKTEGGSLVPIEVDAEALARELHNSISGEVRFDDGTRALYAAAGGNYRQVPIGVVIPKTEQDIKATLAAARRFGTPVLARGGGTSLAGQCCNVAVVMDVSKYMRRILALDPSRKVARVEPGVVLDDLRNAAEAHHLTFAPDPSTHNHCTLGGMIGNNSCGVHSVMGGKTVDNIEELRIVTYDGVEMTVGRTSDDELEQIVRAGGRRGGIYAALRSLRDKYAILIRERYPKIPRRVSGYNLDQLLPENGFHVARALVGTEGTCVTVLEAVCRLVDSPPVRSLLVVGYPDVYSAGDHIPDVLKFGPIGLEGVDDRLIEDMKKKHMHPGDVKLLPDGGGWLLVEFGGQTKQEADGHARRCMEALKKSQAQPSMKLFDDKTEEEHVWKMRESGLGATAFVPGAPPTWEGWEDAAVPPDHLGAYLRDFRKLLDRYSYGCDLYGHFGQGCVHTRIDFDLTTRNGIEKYRRFVHDAAHLVVSHGGSLSGEHGDGQSRAELLNIMFGDELIEAFREFKRIWDPDWKMNPGKKVDPYRVDENLRLGADYAPRVPRTHFVQFGESQTFADAALRCVGVGKCRRESGGTMCPSYMVTHEEQHSTRGRARLLFEMLRGETIHGGWRDESVREALDLCLACKGCKGDCPVNVDMATYKAEFLSHYYAGRLRPPSAYSVGLIHWWSRMASHMPSLVNFASHAPGLGNMVKSLAGISIHREFPRYARQSFQQWFQRRAASASYGHGRRVILWADTFNNYFHPATAIAAVEVLESLGWQVEVPRQKLCCGRPLYDYGMLTVARHLLQDILSTLQGEIRRQVPIVVLEPSCAAVFRDELKNLFPHNEDARRLSESVFLLSEFLIQQNYNPPRLPRKAIVQLHCHHAAIMKADAERAMLQRLGLDFQILDSGCCGMAGGFGFEKQHYDISMQVGERVLLPAVRRADPEALIIADGFSCREQIRQATGRQAQHLAQVVQSAIREEAAKTQPAHRVAGGYEMNANGRKHHEVVVITGGSAGVGRATALAFAKRGAKIGLLARGEDRLRAAQAEVEASGGTGLAVPTDVADPAAVERAAEQIEREFGPIDVWVNNAMTTVFSPFAEITPQEYKRATEVTYLGAVYGTMAALRRMLPRDRGCVVQVGSALAYRSIPLQSPYCGAKHAIVGFTDSLRTELLHDHSHVHLTVVHLPAVNTPQFSWCKTRLPRHPQPVPPIFEPEVAAEGIYWAAHHRRRELRIGIPTVEAIVGNKIAPEALDHYLGRTGYEAQQTSQPVASDRPDNLFQPVPGDWGAHGIFDGQARRHSPQLWATTHRGWLALGSAAAGGLAFYMGLKRRHRGR